MTNIRVIKIRVIKIRVLAALVAAHVAAPAWAQDAAADAAARCFGRAYDAAHLAAHPGQQVVEMLLVVDAYTHEGAEVANVTVRAMVRDRFGEVFANSGFCEPGAGGYDCGIECDGGRFAVELADDGTALLRNEQWGFVLYGGCGEDVGAGREVRIEADAEHSAFRLYPLPLEACPADFWQAYDAFRE